MHTQFVFVCQFVSYPGTRTHLYQEKLLNIGETAPEGNISPLDHKEKIEEWAGSEAQVLWSQYMMKEVQWGSNNLGQLSS